MIETRTNGSSADPRPTPPQRTTDSGSDTGIVTGTGAELFDRLTAPLQLLPGVDEGRMLHSTGLRVNGQVFAFLGSRAKDTAGGLIVKLPASDVAALVDAMIANPVVMGRRTMREWVMLPYHQAAADQWDRAIRAAHAYVSTLPPRVKRSARRAGTDDSQAQ